MKAPRAGSRKAQVFDALQKDGADAAMKVGLGLELAEGTMRSWFGAWGKALKIDATVTTGAPRIPKKAKYEASVRGKDWGRDWPHKGSQLVWSNDNMWHVQAPRGVAVGDAFLYAHRKCLVIRDGDEGMLVRQIAEVEYTPAPKKIERVKAKRAA